MTDPFYEDESVRLFHGDCLDILRELPDCSVDAVVTDPPYGLEFMGREWDAPWKAAGDVVSNPADVGGFQDGNGGNPFSRSRIRYGREGEASVGFQQWCELWATECLRVLKPGGHMLAFGGSRTWHRLACAVEDAGFEIRDSIAWLYGSGFPKSLDVSKAIDKAAGAEREEGTPGRYAARRPRAHVEAVSAYQDGVGNASSALVTAPATPDAQKWQGWGTALKPAHEPVVVGRKPLGLQGILDTIGSHLDVLEAAWQAPEAAPTTRTGGEDDSPAQTDTLPSELETPTNWNTVKSWRACWAELCDLTSTFTTATTSRTTTDLRTLSSSLSKLTQENTPQNGTSPHGLTSLVLGVDNLFASVVCGLRGTLALSATEPATSSTQPQPLDAAEPNRPAFEPIVVGRKPLSSTVAGNVLAHGTGALNIDGCRVAGVGEPIAAHHGTNGAAGTTYGERREYVPGSANADNVQTLGRWPSNVVLDGSQAAELDKQSGVSVSRKGAGATAGLFRIGGYTSIDELRKAAETDEVTPDGKNRARAVLDRYLAGQQYDNADRGHEDSGGASRFFPTFRYEPKAPTTERPRVYVPGCNCETMKPCVETSQRRGTDDSESGTVKSWNTSTSGNKQTDQSPKDSKSTTSTGTSSTTPSETSSRSPHLNTNGSTQDANSETESGGNPAESATNSNQSPPNTGTSAPKVGPSTDGAAPATSPRLSATSVCAECGTPARSEAHATVKPLDLMRWLVRLVTPPGGVVLEPFAGSGTTAEACVVEGFSCIAIEREADYLPLIVQRLTKPIQVALDFT